MKWIDRTNLPEKKGKEYDTRKISLPLATLKELAKARKMRGVSTLKKGDLIDAMLELDEQEEQKEAAEEAREEVKEEKKEDFYRQQPF